MNRERLKTLRDHLAGLPDERVDMRFVISSGDTNLICTAAVGEFLEACGTAACVAGWTGFLFNREAEDYGAWEASKDLDLSVDQHCGLFLPSGFITKGRYTRADAIAAIDSMLTNPDDDALPVWPEKAVAA